MEQVKEVLGDDLEKELNGMDLRSRLFNGNLANPEADRLRNQLRNMYYFNEAWIPELKKSEISGVQLYDLSKDLGQQTDIAKDRPELVARLKEQAAAIHRSVMAEAPEWLTPEEQTAEKKAREALAQTVAPPPVKQQPQTFWEKIEARPLPPGYELKTHQKYVDAGMAKLTAEQRARIGRLWQEKLKADPKMPNRGMSFVKIMEFVAAGEKFDGMEKEKAPN